MSQNQVTFKSSHSDPHTQLTEPTTKKSSEAAHRTMSAETRSTDIEASSNSQAQTNSNPATGMLSPPSSVIEDVERIWNDFEREYEARNSTDFEFNEEDFTTPQGPALAPAGGHGLASLGLRTGDSPEGDSSVPEDATEAARRSSPSKKVSKWEEGTRTHTDCHSQVARSSKSP